LALVAYHATREGDSSWLAPDAGSIPEDHIPKSPFEKVRLQLLARENPSTLWD
jgi:hypothetical protein